MSSYTSLPTADTPSPPTHNGPGHSFAPEPKRVDFEASRFPYCVVWTPLPFLTWILPFVGHIGIADSHGVIYDFAGPYTISVDHMSFGKPTRYVPMDPTLVTAVSWDEAVYKGAEVYEGRMEDVTEPCDLLL
ncbi:hypothetical protein BC938DRAFT_484269 [Jimgerdemannia flammicorona]|uniref:Uncharacterized protein n=1 Tax=Jimgerdemannia flammicorona TaxID=994334 RepID=A0A433QA57_9FUNG|nr:hypothetical protein BC938DRAFT_484269 [Jimgerdemannia flammicorona]